MSHERNEFFVVLEMKSWKIDAKFVRILARTLALSIEVITSIHASELSRVRLLPQ